jgi:hypothetical protein
MNSQDQQPRFWYRQIHWTSWVAYEGDRMIDEAISRGELLRRLEARGIHDAQWIPLRILKFS